MDDNPESDKKIRVVDYAGARVLNQNGYGIFFSINGFNNRRVKENLTSINAWAIDLDSGTKDEMQARILKARLFPSLIIETKRGYHVYWYANEATPDNYKEITEMRLAPFFEADVNAVDICRILRYPGFLHWKDPLHPFLVHEVYKNERRYNESEMLNLFPRQSKREKFDFNLLKKKSYPEVNFTPTFGDSHTFWQKINNLDCKQSLLSLSGSSHVRGDEFFLKPNFNGTDQIWVNGQSSSCWIDKNGMIGSSGGGGPTIANWLFWYHQDWNTVAKILKEHFNIEK